MTFLRYTLLILLFAFELHGQADLDFQSLEYRTVGPSRGGRVTAVCGVPQSPSTFYMGSTGGGLWKTTDYGTSWNNISDGFFKSPAIGAIAVAKQDPNILYVGTGSDGLRSNIITGKGIYKSVNAGKTWTSVGLEKSGHIGAVEIHPQNHNIAFVAAIGNAFAANEERGVFRTKNGGKSWDKVLFLSDTTGFVDLEFMPSNPDIIYAAAWRAERKPWTIISGGKQCGIYKSIDGGDTWVKTGKGLPKMMGKIDLSVSPDNSSVLYALVEAEPEIAGLYRSDDQGESFRLVSNMKHLVNRPFYYTNVQADPQDVETVYVLANRFYRSNDGGKKWTRMQVPHGDSHDIWINPEHSNLMVQSNDGGANISHNGGKTWTHQFNQPTAELYQVEVDNQYPYWLYAGQQDNFTTISVPSLPPNGHQTGGVGLIMETGGCETGPAVPHPDNPDIVYANCKGRFSVFNKKTGQEQRYDVGAAYMYGHNPKDLIYRFQRVAPIHISPHDPGVIYHASQFVHRTKDEGKTWETISPDLTAFEADKQVISGQPFTRDITGEEFYSTIYSIRESALEKGVIWVGANDGPVHVSLDNGENWTNVTPKSLPGGGRVDCVEPSVHQEGKAYFSVLRYQLGDWKPYIYKTTNYGKSWTLLSTGSNGIPDDVPVRVVREDPVQEGLLFAGTEFGMYISFNDGESWQSFQQNLPITPITDIRIHRNDLILSTMGRGFWILDEIGLLRQQYDGNTKAAAVLFEPGTTIRYRYNTMSGMRYLEDHPTYPYPGVLIDYYLPEGTKGPVELHIEDANGVSVIQFTSKKGAKKQAIEDMAANNYAPAYRSDLKTKSGLHRFRWDMRHRGPWDQNANRSFRGGPLVAPGKYTVKLKLGETVLSQSFELKLDPRVLEAGVTLNDVNAQVEFSLQVIDLLSAAKQKAAKAKKELKKLEVGSPAYAATEEAINLLVSPEGWYTETRLIDQISYLYWMSDSGDQLPGNEALKRYEDLKEMLERIEF